MMELEIDPEHWDRAPGGTHRPLEHLLDGYDTLRAFVDATARANAGAVVYVS